MSAPATRIRGKIHLLKHFILIACFLQAFFSMRAQQSKADSLRNLLAIEKIDSNRVRFMWQLAAQININNPDTALLLTQQALYMSRRIGFTEGESRSMNILANTLSKIGNYPRALEVNIERLQLEEKRNIPRNYASVLMNIGVVYDLQEEYQKALKYFTQSDSVISLYHIEEFEYYAALNLGDVYNRLNMADSAHKYFTKSLSLAYQKENGDLIGTSMTGLGHSHLKLGDYEQSLINYSAAITYLQEAGDDETRCEATLGLANLYRQLHKNDSSAYYARLSLNLARQDGFQSKELDAVAFLTDHYKTIRNIDSAFLYADYLHKLNDSLNSKSRIRESQVISSNEQFRQLELEENRKKAEKERFQQLQMLLIAIFIPGFFLLTLLLSRVKVHLKAVRLLGILSLLFFFEYLTLLLHPTIAAITHHTPVYEILIFVVIAAFLIPAHHRLEHWLIHRLLKHHPHQEPNPQEAESTERE